MLIVGGQVRRIIRCRFKRIKCIGMGAVDLEGMMAVIYTVENLRIVAQNPSSVEIFSFFR